MYRWRRGGGVGWRKRRNFVNSLITHSLTCLLTYLLTHLPTYLLTYSLTYLLTYLLTHLLIYLLTYLFTYLHTYSLTYLLTYLLTYSLTYLITYLLTSWSRVPFEKQTNFQLVKKFPTFYGTRRFITAFTRARPPVLILSQINPVHTSL